MLKWKRTEDRMIEELDRRRKYDWRNKIGEDTDFYKDVDSSTHLKSIKEKKRKKDLVYSV
jgi:hypothetical protein